MSAYADKYSVEFWKDIKAGTIVLEDEQSIEESMKAGLGAHGKHYQINDILTVEEEDKRAIWRFFELQDTDETLWLLAKIVGDNVDLRIYFEDEEAFMADTREGVIEQECYWLFQEPEDPDDFVPGELEFTRAIFWDFEDGEGEVKFTQKPQGVLCGTCTIEPPQPGIRQLFTTIAEYSTDADIENNEILILETGGIDGNGEILDEGGFVRLLFGCEVLGSEIDVIPK